MAGGTKLSTATFGISRLISRSTLLRKASSSLSTSEIAAPLLPGIACPTLVLTGRQDAWSPPAQHEAMAQAIPGAVLSIVEDCGHMSTLEQAQAVNAALAAWLARPAA